MKCKLGALCSYVKEKVKTETLDKKNYISTENMLSNKGGITLASSLPSTEYTSKYQAGDILISNIRPYFKKIWKAEYDGGCSNDVLVLRANDDCYIDFLYYALASDSFFDYATATAKGTKMPRGDKTAIMDFEVPYFDFKIQVHIAGILKSLEEKIALNNKINDNLEQQAAALFAYFYDRAETEVGFTEIIQILGGGTPKTKESTYWDGDILFFTPKDVNCPYTISTEKTITEDGLNHCNSRLYPVNTVFVTARGTVGKVCMSGVPMAMNQSCYALVGKNLHQLMVYFYTLATVERLKHKASGAVFDAITTRDFSSEYISKLSEQDERAFIKIVEPMFQMMLSNVFENKKLENLRDTLLPKLMTGEML